MKKIFKLAIIAMFTTGVAFASLAHNTPTASAVSEAASPRSLYLQNCARCHGSNGKANTSVGEKLGASDISGGLDSAKVIRTVTNGRDDMPSFRKKLSKAQIKSIAGYVRSL